MTKVCSSCGKEKDISEFRLNKEGRYKWPRSKCKTCEGIYNAAYKSINKERFNGYQAKARKKRAVIAEMKKLAASVGLSISVFAARND